MKLSVLLFFLLFLFSSCSLFQVDELEEEFYSTESTNSQLVASKETFLKLLTTHKDGFEFLEQYPQTQVLSFELLDSEQIQERKFSSQFKELYENLPQKELYYVEFTNFESMNLMTIIDLENASCLRVFGKYLLQFSS